VEKESGGAYRLSKAVKIYARMYRNLKGLLGKQMPEVKLLEME